MESLALQWDFPGSGPNALTSAEDRARVWEAVRCWYDETRVPASAAVGPLFHHVDNVRTLFDMLPAELPAWYRQKYGPWLKPSPLAVSRAAWAAVLAGLGANVALFGRYSNEAVLIAVRTQDRVSWQRVHPRDRRARQRPDMTADRLTLWGEAQRAHRSLYAMVGMSRVLPRELCWTILGLLDFLCGAAARTPRRQYHDIWAES